METFRGKPVIDLKQAPDKEEVETVETEKVEEQVPERIPFNYFTVTTIQKRGPVHILVKAESIIDAIIVVSEKEKAPIIGAHITEYSKYYETVSKLVKSEEIKDTEGKQE